MMEVSFAALGFPRASLVAVSFCRCHLLLHLQCAYLVQSASVTNTSPPGPLSSHSCFSPLSEGPDKLAGAPGLETKDSRSGRPTWRSVAQLCLSILICRVMGKWVRRSWGFI